MILLDRYILRSFLVPFLLCFFGFLAIWLVFDLQSNSADFHEAHVSARRIADYYVGQAPQFMLLCIPVGLLLALLFCLSKMSRSNEIIAMLTAGQSLTRLLLPLIGVGLFLSGVCALLNYSLAPHAESLRKQFKDEIRDTAARKLGRSQYLDAQLFRNRADRRIWYVAKMKRADEGFPLEMVTILEQNEQGAITSEWLAATASYKPETKSWLLAHGRTVQFAPDGTIQSEKTFLGTYQIDGWSETPWRVASSNLDAQGLSVPELNDYLRYNADFPPSKLAAYRTNLQYRWALPLQCLVVVLFTSPLAIVFSRRGVLSGIAGAIFLFAGMTFFSSLMIAVGKGNRVTPYTAAWAPIVIFGVVGVYLLFLKGTNREFPKFSEIFATKPKR